MISLSKLAYAIRLSGWFSPLLLEERTFGPMVVLLESASAHSDVVSSDRRRKELLRMAVEDARLVQARIAREVHLRSHGRWQIFSPSHILR